MAKVKTTFNLDKELLVRLKRAALDRETSVTKIIEDALTRWLQQPKDARNTGFRLRTHGVGGFYPGVDLSDNAALRDRLDRS